jgi:hypothetical protein
MSLQRANVVFQSKNGLWSRAFFTVTDDTSDAEYQPDDEDFDPLWDVGYDYTSFGWVSTGHATEEDAVQAWFGANPGANDLALFSEGTADQIDEYEEMAREYTASGGDPANLPD